MPLTVDYLFRRRPGTFSIERVFDAMIPALPEDISARRLQVPRETNGYLDTIPNILWARRNCGGIVHITGDINYCAIGQGDRQVVLTIHDLCILQNYTGWRRWLHRKLWFDMVLSRCTTITCISKYTRDELRASVNWKGDAEVIYNPVGSEFQFSVRDFNSDCPRILHFNVTPNKNLLATIAAIKGMKCSLRIIGRPTAEQLALLSQNEIAFSWAENLTSDEIAEEYRLCDMLCFPSTYEGFGMPIAEAQSTGRAVLTSDRPPMTEVAGQGACFVNPDDVSSIRQGIERIVHDKVFRQEIIARGAENAKRFAANVIAAQYAQIYRR
ncbi:MAG: glycosyltransferase family 4 protein [Victivallales bacterium]|nr:glycosyltransferase family 4 protein [Victivallales bacterium]